MDISMPVQKFKSFEEAEKALWTSNPDDAYFKKVREFYKLFAKLSKFSYPSGVYKFRSVEEAERHKMDQIIKAALKEKKVNHAKTKTK